MAKKRFAVTTLVVVVAWAGRAAAWPHFPVPPTEPADAAPGAAAVHPPLSPAADRAQDPSSGGAVGFEIGGGKVRAARITVNHAPVEMAFDACMNSVLKKSAFCSKLNKLGLKRDQAFGATKGYVDKNAPFLCSGPKALVDEWQADATTAESISEQARKSVYTLNDWCEQRGEFKSAALPLEGMALNFVQGLGDAEVELAKEQLASYAVELLGVRLCRLKLTIGKKTLEVKDLFDSSCKIVDPSSGSFDQTTVDTGELQKAIKDDLTALPGRLIKNLLEGVPWEGQWASLLNGLVKTIDSLIHGGRPVDFFANLLGSFRSEQNAFTCHVGADASLDALCSSLFMIEIGSVAEKQRVIDPLATLQDGAKAFCSDFIEGAELPTCFGKLTESPTMWGASVKQMTYAAASMPTLQANLDALAATGQMPSEITRRSLPDLLRAIEVAAGALIDVAAKQLGDPNKARLLAVKPLLQIPTLVLAHDTDSIIEAVRQALAALADTLPPDAKRAVVFVLDVAGAKDRTEVKKIIKEAAAPLGTYKMKYNRKTCCTLTVNSYVGLFAGWSSYESKQTGAPDNGNAYRLAGPITLDLTFTPWKWNHLGLGVIAIDPLALTTVDQAGKTTSVNWVTLFTPGLYVRMGIAGSPIAAMFEATYQPGLKSPDTCGDNKPCWSGAWQFGFAVAVDVPLLVVH